MRKKQKGEENNMLFRVNEFLKENNLNSEILGYYYCPYLRIKENGLRESNVRIRDYNRACKTVKLFCPDIKNYLVNRKMRYIETEVFVEDLEYRVEKGEENLNVEFVKYFCNVTPKKIEMLKKYPEREIWLSAKAFHSVDSKIELKNLPKEKELQYLEENDLDSFVELYLGLYSTDKEKFRFVKNVYRIRRYFEMLRYEMGGRKDEYIEVVIKDWKEKFRF